MLFEKKNLSILRQKFWQFFLSGKKMTEVFLARRGIEQAEIKKIIDKPNGKN